MRKYGAWFFLVVSLLIVVLCILIVDRNQMFSDVKWTDVGVFLVTFLGFTFGFFTYFQWLHNKQKEDAYLSAKKYIASIDEIEECLYELMFQYGHICPASGVLVESRDISEKRIEHLNIVWDYLYQAHRNLYKAHRELEFWKVGLKHNFIEDHESMNQILRNISVTCSVLNNQLFWFIKDENDKSMDEVISSKKSFDRLYSEFYEISQKRIQSSFVDMFKFE